MKHKYQIAAISILLLLFWEEAAYTHDVWLFPEQTLLSKGDTLVIHQYAGSDLKIEIEVELMRLITPRFELITPGGAIDLLEELPDFQEQPVVKPVLKRKLDFEGLALLTMEHAFIYNEWTKEKFLHYLEHEEFNAGDSSPSGENLPDKIIVKETQTERYARFIKCLVKVGNAQEGDLYKRKLGQKSEIIFQKNPFTLGAGDDLPVQALYEGQPDPGQLITAFNGNGNNLVSETKVRTDTDGIARISLNGKGFWLIRFVHLAPSPDPDVDWESYWTCYSFELN